jgi:flagellar biosynthesis/type III secretory pathway chaperone
MSTLIAQLVESMQQIQGACEQLVSFLQQEKNAALASDIQKMVTATQEKARVLCRIKELDLERNRLIGKLAVHLRLNAAKPSLSMIAQQVEPFYGNQLYRLNDSLKDLLSKIRQVNKESRLIVRHCLSLVQNRLSFFNFWTTGSTVYKASGAIQTSRSGGNFVSNTA